MLATFTITGYQYFRITSGKENRYSNGWWIRGWRCMAFHCSSISVGGGGGGACLVRLGLHDRQFSAAPAGAGHPALGPKVSACRLYGKIPDRWSLPLHCMVQKPSCTYTVCDIFFWMTRHVFLHQVRQEHTGARARTHAQTHTIH